MARELHDIASHHLSGIALMASAIERQIATDPSAAESGIRQVRAQSRAVLDDLRRLVGLLRTGDDAGAVKTVATVPELVEAASAAGTPVRLEVLQATEWALADGIGPLGQLAAYRMVQESLTNVLRHAPGASCSVTVDDRDAERLRIVVRNDAAAAAAAGGDASGGFGLLGMRERAALVGGCFDAGPTKDGGWEARMSIPRTADGRDESESPA